MSLGNSYLKKRNTDVLKMIPAIFNIFPVCNLPSAQVVSLAVSCLCLNCSKYKPERGSTGKRFMDASIVECISLRCIT